MKSPEPGLSGSLALVSAHVSEEDFEMGCSGEGGAKPILWGPCHHVQW